MGLREALQKVTGVWVGDYTHLEPDGALVDRHACRQEVRLIGDAWFERIIYRWPDGREEVQDFRARVDGERMVMDDPNFHGETFRVRDDLIVFPYFWKDRPERRIVETVVFTDTDHRTRVWQTHVGTDLQRLTVIRETRRPAETPAEWS